MKTLLERLKRSLPVRTLRKRKDEAVWFFQQSRVRRHVEQAFSDGLALVADAEPTLMGSVPEAADSTPLLLACCDEGYFEQFGVQLATSSVRRSAQTRIHLHIFQPSPTCIAGLPALQDRIGPNLTISYEGPERNPYRTASKFYFASARFAVAAKLRRTIQAPIMVIDADGIVANDLVPGFKALENADLSLFLRPELAPNYRKVLASSVYLGSSAAAADFIDRLAVAIALSFREQPHFHVDQLSLWFALEHCRARDSLRVQTLDRRWSDYEFQNGSYIWTAKGARKSQFDRLTHELDLAAQA